MRTGYRGVGAAGGGTFWGDVRYGPPGSRQEDAGKEGSG
jgi:hypothetical protein